MSQSVQRGVDAALDGVLNGNNGVINLTVAHHREGAWNIERRDQFRALICHLHGGGMAESAARPEKRESQLPLGSVLAHRIPFLHGFQTDADYPTVLGKGGVEQAAWWSVSLNAWFEYYVQPQEHCSLLCA